MADARSRKAPPSTRPSLPPRSRSSSTPVRKTENVDDSSAPIPVRKPTRAKEKSRKAASMAAGSKIVWILSGLLGGIVGGGIWGAISYFTGFEIVWAAVGVGVLVGICVRSQAGGHAGFETGIGAAVITISCVLLAQYFTQALMETNRIYKSIVENPKKVVSPDEEEMMKIFAYRVAEEQEQAGTKLVWPEIDKEKFPNTSSESLFPPGIYSEGKRRWVVKSRQERDRLMAEEYAARQRAVGTALIENGTFMQIASNLNLFDSLGPMSYLFIGIAAVTAFRMAGGMG